MVTVREATQRAKTYLKEAMPEIASTDDLRLEEIELDEAQQIWKITFSIPNPYPDSPGFGVPGKIFGSRIAKVIALKAIDGSFLAVKRDAA